jgi:hypothetical protein
MVDANAWSNVDAKTIALIMDPVHLLVKGLSLFSKGHQFLLREFLIRIEVERIVKFLYLNPQEDIMVVAY